MSSLIFKANELDPKNELILTREIIQAEVVTIKNSMLRLTVVGVLMAGLVIATTLACSSGTVHDLDVSAVPEPTAVDGSTTPSPISGPSPTVTFTPTSVLTGGVPLNTSVPATQVPTPVPNVVLPKYVNEGLGIEGCQITGDLGKSGYSNQGTAPAPSPAPAASMGERDPVVVQRELSAYRLEMDPIAAELVIYNDLFSAVWELARTEDTQAAQLFTFGNRLAQLCNAISQISIPLEIFPETAGIGEAIRTRYSWVTLAIEELQCCSTAHSEFLKVGFISTDKLVNESTSTLAAVLESFAVLEDVVSDRPLENEILLVDLTIPNEAIVVRNSISIVIGFGIDAEVLDPVSLGPDSWIAGNAVQIRRIRNRDGLTVAEVAESNQSLLTRYGEVVAVDGPYIAGVDELNFRLVGLDSGWGGSVTIYVHAGFIYIVESMCNADLVGECDSVDKTIASLKVRS